MITTEQIQELEHFFSDKSLPNAIELGPGENITDVRKFVESHLQVIRNYPNVPAYNVFYLRLIKLREMFSKDI